MSVRNRSYTLLVLIVATLCLLAVAAPLGLPQSYLMAAALILVLPIFYAMGALMMGGVTAERTLPASSREGERVRVVVQVHNPSRLPKFYLRVRDRLPRWVRPTGDDSGLILHLNPGESSQVSYFVESQKRGVYQVGPAQLSSTDPLGFYTYTQTLPGTTELLVYPSVLPLRNVFWEGAFGHGWREQDGGRSRGGGLDFQGVREYRSGDELRRVHWRTTARTGQLAVSEYAQGVVANVAVVLDLNREAYVNTGQGPESALEYGVKIAAALCDYLVQQGSAVQLILTQTNGPTVVPVEGVEQRVRILDALARVEADSRIALPEALGLPRLPLPAGATLVYITPDSGSPALAAVLAEYRAAGVQPVGFGLEAESFRPGSAGAGHSSVGGEAWLRVVRRGDDLTRIIEGGDYA